jgi:hypothetical protein
MWAGISRAAGPSHRRSRISTRGVAGRPTADSSKWGGLLTTGAPCGLEFLAQALTLPAEPPEYALECLAL